MSVTMRQMLEAGVHFGHQTRYWNPKMAPYIFGHRNKIHIINLEKTLSLYQDAMKFVRGLAANKGNVLFVGTKRQARHAVEEEAKRVGMHYVSERWLGGTLTNFRTIRARPRPRRGGRRRPGRRRGGAAAHREHPGRTVRHPRGADGLRSGRSTYEEG